MQRLVYLSDDERGQVGRIGFETHAACEGEENLPCIVFFAEEPLVQPAPRPVPVLERGHGGTNQRQIQPRAPRRGFADRLRAVARERGHQRNRGKDPVVGQFEMSACWVGLTVWVRDGCKRTHGGKFPHEPEPLTAFYALRLEPHAVAATDVCQRKV